MKDLKTPVHLFAFLFFSFTAFSQSSSLDSKDLQFFKNFWPEIEKAWNNGDREPYIAGHEHSVYMVPNSNTLSTPRDIRTFVESFPESKSHYSGFEISGNKEFVGVKGLFKAEDMNGQLLDKGKFLTTFSRGDDGKWVMTYAIWNSDLPIPRGN